MAGDVIHARSPAPGCEAALRNTVAGGCGVAAGQVDRVQTGFPDAADELDWVSIDEMLPAVTTVDETVELSAGLRKPV